jgi:uncharacterized HAD superfamily protein
MTPMLAVIDIDDTLAATTPFMLEYLNRRHSTSFRLEDTYSHFLADCYPAFRDTIDELVVADWFQLACPPLIGAPEATRRMRDLGYEIWLVTGRPECVRESSLEWLDRWGFAHDRLIMGLMGAQKTSVLPHRVSLAFEDRADAALAFADYADLVHLIACPWNQHPVDRPNLRRVCSWREVHIPIPEYA